MPSSSSASSASSSAAPSVLASPATSPSPAAVHDIVCEFVAAQAQAETAASVGWAGYREVFLSAEVQDLIRARLEEGAAAASPVEGSISGVARSPKKRNLEADAAPAPPPPAAAAAAPAAEVSWRVCCLDGTTFSVAVPEGARVAEMKRAIGALREVPHYAMELFVEGKEEPLDDEKRLVSAKVPLFMLPKQVSDRLALEALFKSCGGAGWERKGGWMTDAGLGEWQGVTVDAEGRVTELDLCFNYLAGPLPSEVLQLSALQELNLGENELTGPIPAELGQLTVLTALDLYANQLTGLVPAELGQLGELKVLDLRYNELSGAVPAELAWLPALAHLFLYNNQLSGQEAFRSQMEERNPNCELVLVPEDLPRHDDDD